MLCYYLNLPFHFHFSKMLLDISVFGTVSKDLTQVLVKICSMVKGSRTIHFTIYLLLWYQIRQFMILHCITSQRGSNFSLFSLGETTGNYFTPVTSIITNIIYLKKLSWFYLQASFKVVSFMWQSLNLLICFY